MTSIQTKDGSSQMVPNSSHLLYEDRLNHSEADKVRCGIEHFKELGVSCEVVVSGLDV